MSIFTQLAVPLLILVYITITFLFSALEKLFHWKESLTFYKGHFKESFIKNHLLFLLALVIALELIVSILCLIGIYYLSFFNDKAIGYYGLVLASITLIGLMFGQRLAKDYQGAMLITVYFILSVFGAFILQ